MNYVQENKENFELVINHLRQEISSLRTGRATPAIVEDIMVEAYDSRQSVKSVASISIPDPKTIFVEPWDKSLLKAVEDGIRNSQIGLNPVNDGKMLKIPLPQLTQERRQELIKVLHQKLEAARISVRQLREDIKRNIEKAEKDKIIGEDEKFKQIDALDKLVKEYNDKIKVVGEEKEKEVNTI